MKARYPHCLVTPWLCNAFEMLRVSASIKEPERWRVLHYERNVQVFEPPHGVEAKRDRYNGRHMNRALRTGKVVFGRHAGVRDLFAPIAGEKRPLGVLVAGPFADARLKSAEIRENWRWLTGREAHLSDPEFSDYLAVRESTLTLEGDRLKTFERFVSTLAHLLSGKGDPNVLLPEAEGLRDRVEEARFVDRTWEAARSMLDERTEQSWQRPYRRHALRTMGLSRPPDAVTVGLLVRARADADPIDEVLDRDSFQRAAVELMKKAGEAICCNVGDHGTAILSAAKGSPARKRSRLFDLGERLNALARRHDFHLYLGLSTERAGERLSARYRNALAAAETALSRGQRVVQWDAKSGLRPPTLGELGRELAAIVEAQPLALPARFDRYLESVALHCGYRVDAAQIYLESSYGELAATLLRSGALDAKSVASLCNETSDGARECRTIKDLFVLYRRAIADLSEAARRPVAAHRERSLRSAVAYIDEHYGERLTLAAVSRVAGFAPNYFARLFKEQEHTSFAAYLRRLRIERAKHLLETSDLGVRSIGRLSGFPTPARFFTVFKSAMGMTPGVYREHSRR